MKVAESALDEMTKPRHPEIIVAMVGVPDSALAIIGRCRLAMRRASLPPQELEAFTEEATARDYDWLLRTVLAWFEVDGGEASRSLDPKTARLRKIINGGEDNGG